VGIIPKKQLDPFQQARAVKLKQLSLQAAVHKGDMARAQLSGNEIRKKFIDKRYQRVKKNMERIKEGVWYFDLTEEKWKYRFRDHNDRDKGGEGEIHAPDRKSAADAIAKRHGHRISITGIVPHSHDLNRERSDPAREKEYAAARAKREAGYRRDFAKWKQQSDGRWYHPQHGYAKSKKKYDDRPAPGKARWAPRHESVEIKYPGHIDTKAGNFLRTKKNRDKNWWSAVRSQKKDAVDNDNETDQMRLQRAQHMKQWAADKMSNPSFAPIARRVAYDAETIIKGYRPKVVKETVRKDGKNGYVLWRGDKSVKFSQVEPKSWRVHGHSDGHKNYADAKRAAERCLDDDNADVVRSANQSHKNMWKVRHKLLDAIRMRKAQVEYITKNTALSWEERRKKIQAVNQKIAGLRKKDREKNDIWLRQVQRIKS